MTTSTSILIEKETLNNYKFSTESVIQGKEQKAALKWSLEKALILGNAYHSKVFIHLQTADGQNVTVNTTIWALSDEHIVLKGGTTLPMASIVGIDF